MCFSSFSAAKAAFFSLQHKKHQKARNFSGGGRLPEKKAGIGRSLHLVFPEGLWYNKKDPKRIRFFCFCEVRIWTLAIAAEVRTRFSYQNRILPALCRLYSDFYCAGFPRQFFRMRTIVLFQKRPFTGTAQVRENRPFVSGRPLSAAKPFWKQRQWVFCAHFSAALLRAAISIQAKEETSNGRRDYGPHGAPRLQK